MEISKILLCGTLIATLFLSIAAIRFEKRQLFVIEVIINSLVVVLETLKPSEPLWIPVGVMMLVTLLISLLYVYQGGRLLFLLQEISYFMFLYLLIWRGHGIGTYQTCLPYLVLLFLVLMYVNPKHDFVLFGVIHFLAALVSIFAAVEQQEPFFVFVAFLLFFVSWKFSKSKPTG